MTNLVESPTAARMLALWILEADASAPAEKTCTKCGECKPANQFSRDKSRCDGLQAWCKSCKRKYNLANAERIAAHMREYRQENAESIAKFRREYQREYRAANAERIAEQKREYQRVNRERILDRKRAYRQNNPERDREYQREWRAANPEAVRAKIHRYRARKRNAKGTYTAEDIRALVAGQTDKKGILRCWHCGEPITGQYDVDHFIPLKHGGPNYSGNLRITHPVCNKKKGTKMPAEFNGRLL